MAAALVFALGCGALASERYNRADWPHWIDADGDCQNTRTEVLIAESTTPVVLSDDGCSVKRGTWRDPYTGKTFTDPRKLDVDHVVPLAWAHAHGAATWTRERRRDFANDLQHPEHLIAVDARANRRKGERGPGAWMPERAHCEAYRAAWLAITTRWGLHLGARDVRALDACGGSEARFAALISTGVQAHSAATVLEGASVYLVCLVPERYAARALRIALEGVQASTFESPSIMTRRIVERAPCGEWVVSCTLSPSGERRTAPLTVMGRCDEDR